jgi:SOS-response transcriptional repressor LexA
MKITKKGRQTMNMIYDAIVNFTIENLYPPSIPEIKEITGINSTSTIQMRLLNLELEGKITLGSGSRSIKLNGYKLVKTD